MKKYNMHAIFGFTLCFITLTACAFSAFDEGYLPYMHGALAFTLGYIGWFNFKEKKGKLAVVYFVCAILSLISMVVDLL